MMVKTSARRCLLLTLAVSLVLSLCGSRSWCGPAVPGASANDAVAFVKGPASHPRDEKAAREWLAEVRGRIARRIDDAFSADKAKAQTAQEELEQISRTLAEECRQHRDADKGVEDALALSYLGPIAMRAYLDMAKHHHLAEVARGYVDFFGEYVRGVLALRPARDIGSVFREYLEGQLPTWDDRFLLNCSAAVCDAMAGYGHLLAPVDPQAVSVVLRDPEALLPTLDGLCRTCRVVDPNEDLSALQYALTCLRPHGKEIGTASRDPMVALARIVVDPSLADDPRKAAAAIKAVGAVTGAYGAFFRAARTLPEGLQADLERSEYAWSQRIGPTLAGLTRVGVKVFLQRLKRPEKYAGMQFTFLSQITAQAIALLKSSDKSAQCEAAGALGLFVPAAMDFVDLTVRMLEETDKGFAADPNQGILVNALGQMLTRSGVDLDAGTSRDIFSLASFCFEAIFALAHAATGEDPDVQRDAEHSLRRIFGAPAGEPNQIGTVVRGLIRLLRTNERYVVENEVFNTLFAIPAATRETISRMEEEERRGTSRQACAKWSRERLRDLAKATADAVILEFEPTTELYRARRYLLILGLYGEALPDRPRRYFELLKVHAASSATTALAVKRLIAQEVLQAFQRTNGAGREVDQNTLIDWMAQVDGWQKTSQDDLLRHYLVHLSGEIQRIEAEGYSVSYRLWRWFYGLSLGGEISAVLGLLGLALLMGVAILWALVPAQLTDWAMEDPLHEGFPFFPTRARDILTLARWLGATDRALDAWVARHQEPLVSQTFRLGGEPLALGRSGPDRRKELVDRYVDLGNHKHVHAFCQALRKEEPLAVWIAGEGGGSGKTTLACYMAHTALDQGRRPVIPVVVNVDWGPSLLDSVRRLCHVHGRLLSPTMMRNLAGRGRILLIVDGLSETRGTLDGEAAAFRYVLVTSRAQPPADQKYSIVPVGSLTTQEPRRLHAFIGAYTRDRETRARALRLIQRLADAGGRIRPVFAWLAVDYVKEHGAFLVDKSQHSLLDLITTCVGRQRPRGPHALNESSYYRAAELVAYAVVHRGWAPRMTLRETVQSRLLEESKRLPFRATSGNEVQGDVALEQLEQCGLLNHGSIRQSSLVAKQSYISFAHDVVAEYLAAVYVSKWPEIPSSTQEEMRRSGGDFAGILETVRGATSDPTDRGRP